MVLFIHVRNGGAPSLVPLSVHPSKKAPLSRQPYRGENVNAQFGPLPPPMAGHHLSLPPISLTVVTQGYVCGCEGQRVLSHQNKTGGEERECVLFGMMREGLRNGITFFGGAKGRGGKGTTSAGKEEGKVMDRVQ